MMLKKHSMMKFFLLQSSIHIINAKNFFVCVCIIKLHCHFLPDLAQILNKAMISKGAASKPVPGADYIQLLILRHLFVSHIRTDSIHHAHTTSSMRNQCLILFGMQENRPREQIFANGRERMNKFWQESESISTKSSIL